MQSRRSFAYFILSRVLIFGLISSIPSFQAQAQIAFTSERNGNKEIYVMDADGRNPRNVTKIPRMTGRHHGLLMASALLSCPIEIITMRFT